MQADFAQNAPVCFPEVTGFKHALKIQACANRERVTDFSDISTIHSLPGQLSRENKEDPIASPPNCIKSWREPSL